ncbi:aminoacyl-tRNA hydrolase [Pelosinus sp. sgz500959]|uniref:aminoacyl-tRNA hydrolase n=1 Tax=Pelosinus sp. sgz500959 TaxID=3242472 RepID=UPI00366E6201
MKIVVGLGNPGDEYRDTRHNVGFMAVDEIARRLGIHSWKKRNQALVAEYRGDESILLVKPQTYMNLSGIAVGELARWYKVPVEDVIVIFDDMDLPIGRLRLRMKGGSGGHRGIESLLNQLSKDTFNRVRIGIDRPPTGWQVVDYVLSRFTKEEQPLLESAIDKAAEAVECIVKQGMNKAMNIHNK